MRRRPEARRHTSWDVAPTAAVVLPALGFWAYTFALDRADWEYGSVRALLCIAGVVGVGALRRAHRLPLRANVPVLALLLVGLAAFHGWRALRVAAAAVPPTTDIGQTTLAVAALPVGGESPYTRVVDPVGARVDPDGTGFRFFAGFKYGPAMQWAYAPAVHGWGNGGYFVTSLLAFGLLAAAAAFWVARSASPPRGLAAALGAAALTLLPSSAAPELFVAGVNDAVPMALALWAFALCARGWSAVAGALIGLSFATKLFPAAGLALALLVVAPQRWRFTAAALVTAAVCFAPALIAAPHELIANLVLFNTVRPPDSTSAFSLLPLWMAGPIRIVVLPLGAVCCVGWLRRADRASADVATAAAGVMVLLFLGSHGIHRNYLFWLTPFLAVAVAARVWGGAPRRTSERGGARPYR